MTGDSTASISPKDNTYKPTETRAEQQEIINPLKRCQQDSELRQTDPGMLGETDRFNQRRCHQAEDATMPWLTGQDVHDGVARNKYIDFKTTPGPEPNDYHGRGRTPEREEWRGSSGGIPYGSRGSSASSARSMIDERMEWAHQDRMRSASRDDSIPPSPFHGNSPFYAEIARNSSLASQHGHFYKCDCCPMTFRTLVELRYVHNFA
jgi:hypothetical protein